MHIFFFLAPATGLFGLPPKPVETKDSAAPAAPAAGLFGGVKKDDNAEKKDAPAGMKLSFRPSF